ncbi:hypothetical protein H4R27_003880 [Coemansia aciculifera]|nr:hypothetical protein H4R27_003880 [Coemansia aciculifera]
MSQYQPPPLDSFGPQSAGAKRPSLAPALVSTPAAQHRPLINPFGSPHSPPLPPLRTESASRDDLETQQKPRADDRPVVAFVGGIVSEIDDKRILEMLQACGEVNSWRRAFDPDDNPLTFGFCEFKSLDGVLCALNVLPRAVWTGQSEHAPSSSQPKSLIVTVDKTMQWALDSRKSDGVHSLDVDRRASEQAVLDTVMRIIQESRTLSESGADTRPANKELTDTEAGPAGDDNSGHVVDRSAVLNLESLSITKEMASRSLDSPADRCQPENFEQRQHQPFTLDVEDDWEKEQTLNYRTRRYISAANDRESRLSKDLDERERRMEHDALRVLDRVEERQRAQDLMSTMLSKWDDSEEERLREHEYYRDRERWWHRRKAVRARELELDAIDRQDQELSQKAKVPSPHTDAAGPELAVIEQRQSNLEGVVHLPCDVHSTKQTVGETPNVTVSDVDALFAQPIKWGCVDESFLQAKLEPTAQRLLQEYIGEDADQEVADLAEFVIGHIRDRKSPQSLVEELEMVLVEEAQAFVGQLWSILPSGI